ncbi:Carboxymuconolactone decarboxylase family protein [Pseudovibrio axinellae]|uniref:Carboxymuconolactone decarboxylase family protein n=1 Tax=Pseudovibrio axinellae TaxID=989403 RepID=A0A165XYN7_9HYPH|nr:peroxidase-related enzyme [Pseudovibrio axinellae]KZL18250.1 Carboxymuconolactone decarboxylase family protein [Pseudovibrio axinellae]SER72109.1 uncharacterized peroxidase-related enzyme [Pseudovibrio axinellae]
MNTKAFPKLDFTKLDHPTNLKLGLPEPLPEDIQELFSKCQSKLGLIPNVLVAFAHRPAKLRAFSQMYNELMLGDSGISKLEREMIAVVVSSINSCWYCQVAHGAAVRGYSKTPALGEAMLMNYRFAELTEKQRVMLDFARKVAKASSEVVEGDRQGLRNVGFCEEDIWDICEVAAFFSMSNRMASATGMRPNPEYHSAAR